MAWLTQDAIDFLGELALNNDREWFTANKKRYEKSVKEPMERLAAELITRLKVIDPSITMEPKQAVFRIYRDTRFSKDKAPYKTNAGLSVSSGGKTGRGRPGVYAHLDAGSFGIASGHYFLEPPQLFAMRKYIAANLSEFEKLLSDNEFVKVWGSVRGEGNKVLTGELKEAAKAQPLLLKKQFYYWAEYPAERALADDLPDFVMDHVRVAQPMNEFLTRALQ